MTLGNDLITQFVRVTKDESPVKNETVVYGTAVEYGGQMYVKIDGSGGLLTPVSTTAEIQNGERVTVMIKDHNAVVTGNISSPAARTETVKELGEDVVEFKTVMAHKITADEIEATTGVFETLKAQDIEVVTAHVENLEAKIVNSEHITAKDAEFINAEIEQLEADVANISNLSADQLNAINAEITKLKGYTADFTYVSADSLSAIKATIKQLDADQITVEDANIIFANIDFANIDEAVFRELFAESGMVQYITSEDGTFTGELVGVTISGDLIRGNTIQAEKLVVKGEDGLYYKLNVEGGVTNADQLPKEEQEKLQNGLHGSVIIAKSITAEKVSVTDLVAFGATIGGFHITDSAIYSGVKETADNTTRGVYLDKTGQLVVGDGISFLKYYKDADGNWKLAIAADSITFGSEKKTINQAIDDIEIGGRNLIRNSTNMIFNDYYFYEPGESEDDSGGTSDGAGNIDLNGLSAIHDGNGNVTLIT